MDSSPELLPELRNVLAEARLPLPLAGVEAARTERIELIDQLDGYLLPRLARLGAPLLVVLGGSTGSGKSTLTNALCGAEVTVPGVLRPTTRLPVLACHPDDVAWFTGADLLGDLPRVTGPGDDTGGAGLRVTSVATLPPGLALLDSPDIDSVEIANHDLAALLLGAADLWLFVTTAVRYADAVPWEYLRRARDRSVAVAVVVNRVPAGAEAEVGDHLRSMLDQRGLDDAELLTVAEGELGPGSPGDGPGVAQVRAWLDGLAGSAERRDEVVRRTVAGLVASIPKRVATVSAALTGQAAAADALAAAATHAWASSLDDVDEALRGGVVLHAEVLDRFREHVGTGELMDRLQRGIGRVRSRVASAVTGRAPVDAEVRRELGSTVASLVEQSADRAALATVEAWESMPGGAEVLSAAPRGIDRASAELAAATRTEIEAWQEDVLALVVERAGSKVAVARGLSLGINGVGAAVMLAVFSQTGGLSGAEAVVAGGTAAAGQAVLSAVFGDQAVRELVRDSRRNLLHRVDGLFAAERARFESLLDVVPAAARADELRRLAAGVASGP